MNVRRLVLALSLVASGVTLAGQATPPKSPSVDVDEIVGKSLDAMGGLDKLQDIQTMKKVAKVTMQGRQVTTTMYFKRPNMSRQEVQVDGQTVINAFDGTTPWIINPLAGFNRPVTVSGTQAASIREDAWFDGPLVDYKNRGTIIDYVAREPLGEGEAHHLRVTSASRQIRHLYLDATTFLELKLAADVGGAKLEQLSSDYRDVDGVKVAHHLKTVVNGAVQTEMQLESVEFNLPLETALFRMPKVVSAKNSFMMAR
jgi:outer membrane lipoprotein-sorting protein